MTNGGQSGLPGEPGEPGEPGHGSYGGQGGTGGLGGQGGTYGGQGGTGGTGGSGRMPMTSSYHKAMAILTNVMFVLVLLTSAASVYLYNRVSNNQNEVTRTVEKVLTTHCSFFRDIGTLPVIATTVNGHSVPPSRIGVKLVIDSRTAYRGIGACKPALPPPSAGLIQYAKLYNLKP